MGLRHKAGLLIVDVMSDQHTFESLMAELDRWNSQGQRATLWWRNDDAGLLNDAMERLLALANRWEIVCGVAAVPAWLESAASEALSQSRYVAVLQHGYAHIDHTPRGEGLGAWELGPHRTAQSVLADLTAGRAVLEDQLGQRFLPVIAPPWNHIDPALFSGLVEQGYRGVTAEGPRMREWAVPGLRAVNIHTDPISWKGGARFKGADKTVASLVDHLAARRLGAVDPGEPTGLITHHRDMCSACWEFVGNLFDVTKAHPAADWQDPCELWP